MGFTNKQLVVAMGAAKAVALLRSYTVLCGCSLGQLQ
jgi:hypothetical protein